MFFSFFHFPLFVAKLLALLALFDSSLTDTWCLVHLSQNLSSSAVDSGTDMCVLVCICIYTHICLYLYICTCVHIYIHEVFFFFFSFVLGKDRWSQFISTVVFLGYQIHCACNGFNFQIFLLVLNSGTKFLLERKKISYQGLQVIFHILISKH